MSYVHYQSIAALTSHLISYLEAFLFRVKLQRYSYTEDRHTITGWSIVRDPRTKEMVYEVKFKRLATETSMELVLRRPYSDEIEDYKEYKRLRRFMREKQDRGAAKTKTEMAVPALMVSSDGASESDIAYRCGNSDGDGDGDGDLWFLSSSSGGEALESEDDTEVM